MIRYALLTYGRRPSTEDEWRDHPQMWTQLVLTKVLATRQGHEVSGVAFDYHRAPRSLADLPRLRLALSHAKRVNTGVMVDSLGRLLRAAPPKHRENLLAELRAFGECLYCAHSKARLCDIDDTRIGMLLQVDGLERGLAHAARRITGQDGKRTESARDGSGAVRKMRGRKTLEQLEAIRSELRAAGRKATGDEIAKIANERGLRTQRGSDWTGAAIRQALRQQSAAVSGPEIIDHGVGERERAGE